MKLLNRIKNAFTEKPIVKDTATEKPIIKNSESINYKIETIGEPVIGRRVRDLKTGETGYVVPWCYDIKTGELNMNHTFTETPQGTSSMPIKKTRKGFEIDFNFDYFGGQYEF